MVAPSVPLWIEKTANHKRDERESVERGPHAYIGHVLDAAAEEGAKPLITMALPSAVVQQIGVWNFNDLR